MNSVGFTSINSSWDRYPFIAHPIIDRFNDNNLMVIGHDTMADDPEDGKNLGVGVFDTEHDLLNSIEVPLNHAQEVHDMAATEHYMIVFDFNVWFGPDLF